MGLAAGPEPGDHDSHHLVVTHAFTIGWLVRHACGAPPWRWVGLNSGHTALTVVRYVDDRPPTLVLFNDMSHLSIKRFADGDPALRPGAVRARAILV